MTAPVGIAVVGAGLVGVRHIDAMSRVDNVALCAVVDTSDAARRIAAVNQVPFYTSLEELFAKAPPDGVLLATPTTLHLEQGLQCIDAGCPVLIEKPIAVTADDAMTLVTAAAEKSIPVLVGHHRRHNPLIQKASELIEAGEIGQIRSAQGTCWLYKPDDYFEIAPWRKQKGAGPVSVNLVHDIDLMRYLMGDVVQVQATATQSLRGFDNEDVAAAVLKFKSGAVATITVSDAIVGPWSWELTAGENPAYPQTSQSCLLIGGSEGSLSIPDLTVWSNQGAKSWWNPMNARSVPREFSDPLVNQLQHFGRVISGDETPLVSGLEGMKSLQVIEAIQHSAVDVETVTIQQ